MSMHTRVITCLALFAISASATASMDQRHCQAATSQWQPREALQQQLQADRWKVRRIELDDGCYEAHVTDAKGLRHELKVDPQALTIVRREQDD